MNGHAHRIVAIAALSSVLIVHPAQGTSNHRYGSDEYITVVSGESPNGQYSIATHGEGEYGYDNFHVYLMDGKRGRKIGPLDEIKQTVDTGPDAFYAHWSGDSQQVSVTYRVDRKTAVEVSYQIADGRASRIAGPMQVDGLPGNSTQSAQSISPRSLTARDETKNDDSSSSVRGQKESVVELINAANQFANAKEYDRAITLYTRAIKIAPNMPVAFFNRATAYRDSGDIDLAIADYGKATQVGDVSPEDRHARQQAFVRRGEIYLLNLKQYASALADFDSALKVEPDDSDAIHKRGHTHAQMGNHEKAVIDYRKALQITPGDANLLAGLRQSEEQLSQAKLRANPTAGKEFLGSWSSGDGPSLVVTREGDHFLLDVGEYGRFAASLHDDGLHFTNSGGPQVLTYRQGNDTVTFAGIEAHRSSKKDEAARVASQSSKPKQSNWQNWYNLTQKPENNPYAKILMDDAARNEKEATQGSAQISETAAKWSCVGVGVILAALAICVLLVVFVVRSRRLPAVASAGEEHPVQSNTVSAADEIRKLAELRSEGIISDEEFQKRKERYLAN